MAFICHYSFIIILHCLPLFHIIMIHFHYALRLRQLIFDRLFIFHYAIFIDTDYFIIIILIIAILLFSYIIRYFIFIFIFDIFFSLAIIFHFLFAISLRYYFQLSFIFIFTLLFIYFISLPLFSLMPLRFIIFHAIHFAFAILAPFRRLSFRASHSSEFHYCHCCMSLCRRLRAAAPSPLPLCHA